MREESDLQLFRRAGFWDPARAVRLLSRAITDDVSREWLIEHLTQTGDPDQGLLGYIRLLEAATAQGRAATDALYHTCQQPEATRRLFAVLGMSSTLTDILVAHPSRVSVFASAQMGDKPLETSSEIERARALDAIAECEDEIQAVSALREHYWMRIAQIAAVDLTAESAPGVMPAVSAAVSDIVSGTLEAALAIATRAIENGDSIALSVIAMGKTGGRELNYISDVDVIYLARAREEGLSEADMLETATQVASLLSRVVSAPGEWPALWELDTNLRPEGKDGPLVRTLESHVAYYERWAQDWEFQALLKARPVAGDLELGERYIAALGPLVWNASAREHFVEDTRDMRRRVEDLVPRKDAERQLKLGRGGLRDVEFTVQLLQLVHGRTDESLRQRGTLNALSALSAGGYIARAAAEKLEEHYRFLRTLEHRIQLHRFHRSHTIPTSEPELRRIARSLQGTGIDSADNLEAHWKRVRREVRELHLEIYYRPLLPHTARLSPDELVLKPDAARARLAAIGFKNHSAALADLEALTAGISRTAVIQKHLLPVMIGWMAEGPDPDYGLASFRTLSEKMGSTSWYMRLLRDSKVVAERLAHLLSTSRYVADAFPSLSEAISWLDDDDLLRPRSREDLGAELESMVARRVDPAAIARAGRYLRRRELLRAAIADVLQVVDLEAIRRAITVAGEIAVEAALRGAIAEIESQDSELLSEFLVVAMGRFGGAELGYASDADLLFVHRPHAESDAETAQAQAIDISKRVIALLSGVDQEPAFPADADLRPEGRSGLLCRSFDAYREYYERWVDTWEIQALIRARPIAIYDGARVRAESVAGASGLDHMFKSLIDLVRYPADGLTNQQTRDIRAMKARMERERIPRSIDPTRHLKLGRGSLADIEWTAQLLQLRYAGKTPSLRVTGTIEALRAAEKAGLIDPLDADRLVEAWSLASMLRDANVLGTGRVTGTKIDVLPHVSLDLAVAAAVLGVDHANRRDIEENYLRSARRARKVVERVFYGEK